MLLALTPSEAKHLTDALAQAYLRYDSRRQAAKTRKGQDRLIDKMTDSAMIQRRILKALKEAR